jgi:L-rhamnonate dehydratase
MHITRITAHALAVPVQIQIPGAGPHQEQLDICIVEVETDQGLVGHGLTAITQGQVVASIVNQVIGPALAGTDPLAHEARWDQMYWLTSSRGQTGYASHAIAAVDVALWDLKGRFFNQPIWRLLGAARPRVPVYSTFGFDFLDRDELVSAARAISAQGLKHLKMVVGHRALHRRDHPKGRDLASVIAEDARRVRAVRDALGPDAWLYIDANCGLDAYHAGRLAHLVSDCSIGFFEEPITQNDAAAMADLRRLSGTPLACGQNEGLAYRFREWLVSGSVDFVQPNVVISGGYTQCVRIAALAGAFNVNVTNGGAYPLHNMHLQAGVANGTKVEWHLPVVAMMEMLYEGFPVPAGGLLEMSDAPGLGFQLRREAIKEFAAPAD